MLVNWCNFIRTTGLLCASILENFTLYLDYGHSSNTKVHQKNSPYIIIGLTGLE